MRHRFFLIAFIILLLISFVYTNIPRKVSQTKQIPGKGLIYKASWNKDTEYLFVSDKFKVLVRGSESDDKLASGCIVILKSKLIVPDKPTNPGGFDYRKYLMGKGVAYYTYAELSDIEIIDTEPGNLRAWGAKVRCDISNTLENYMSADKRALVMAIMTGDAGDIGRETKNIIQLAGLSHLMAVSGSHVFVFLFPFKKAFRNRYMNIWVRNVLLIFPLICFLFISDVTPSVLRSVMSVIFSIIALLLKRKNDSLNTLGLIGSYQLIRNPYVIYDAGFLLSYGSVFSIIILFPALVRYLKSKGIYKGDYTGGGSGRGTGAYEKSKIVALNIDGLLTGVAVNIGILPVIASMFNRLNFIGVLLTCLASPIASCILISGYLLYISSKAGLGFLSMLLSYFITFVIFLLERILQLATALPSFLTGLVVPSYGIPVYFCYYLVLTVIILKARIKRVYLVRVLLLVLSVQFILYRPVSEVVFYDVGQGNCIYIESKYGTRGLIDSGEGFTKVSELLLKRGVSELDFIVVSHGHLDHIGGMYDIVDTFKIKYIFVPDNYSDEEIMVFSEYAERKGIKVIKVTGSTYYRPDKALSAELLFYFDKNSLNNSSLMVKLNLEQLKILIASDIEKEAESYYVNADKVFDCDILQVPHHGSDTSSTPAFLEKADPETAVICVGRKNKFGHPNKTVLERLNECDIYRTDNDGAVIIRITGRNYRVKKVIADDISGF